jgi:hypothetical protein
MDAYSGLTNIGRRLQQHGLRHNPRPRDHPVLRCPTAVFEHKLLFFSVTRSAADVSLYEATRHAHKAAFRKSSRPS